MKNVKGSFGYGYGDMLRNTTTGEVVMVLEQDDSGNYIVKPMGKPAKPVRLVSLRRIYSSYVYEGYIGQCNLNIDG